MGREGELWISKLQDVTYAQAPLTNENISNS